MDSYSHLALDRRVDLYERQYVEYKVKRVLLSGMTVVLIMLLMGISTIVLLKQLDILQKPSLAPANQSGAKI